MPQMKPTYWLVAYTLILLTYMMIMPIIHTFSPNFMNNTPHLFHSTKKWTWQW